MKFNQFEVGTKFRYKKRDLTAINYWFDCGGNVMIVQAISANIQPWTKFLWVHEIYDFEFEKCELIK